jgi:hypothetical protein
VPGLNPDMILGSSSLTSSRLCPHSNVATHRDSLRLLTPGMAGASSEGPSGSLHGVAMHLAYPTPVGVDRPCALGAGVVRRHVDPLVTSADPAVFDPLAGVVRRP